MFQIITAFELKLKLWQSQVKVNNFMYFPVLAKYNPKNSEKYASLILILINEFETRFQDFRKNSQLFAIFATPFSVNIPTVETKFQMECIELQSDIQLKEKFNQTSLLDFYKLYLPKETYPVLHDHSLFMFSLFGIILKFKASIIARKYTPQYHFIKVSLSFWCDTEISTNSADELRNFNIKPVKISILTNVRCKRLEWLDHEWRTNDDILKRALTEKLIRDGH
ncbi:hypothetical protein QTP88_007713 [Uroleucon formosanum]